MFLILEFAAGGELFYKLGNIESGKMREKQAIFILLKIIRPLLVFWIINNLCKLNIPKNFLRNLKNVRKC